MPSTTPAPPDRLGGRKLTAPDSLAKCLVDPHCSTSRPLSSYRTNRTEEQLVAIGQDETVKVAANSLGAKHPDSITRLLKQRQRRSGRCCSSRNASAIRSKCD
jgi:hypothetical protein